MHADSGVGSFPSLAVHPDGNFFAAGGDAGGLFVYTTKTADRIMTISDGVPGGVRDVAFNENGIWVALACATSVQVRDALQFVFPAVCVWQIISQSHVHHQQDNVHHGCAASGGLAATAIAVCSCQLIRIACRRSSCAVNAPAATAQSISCMNGFPTLQVWDLRKTKVAVEVTPFEGPVTTAATFDFSGKYLVRAQEICMALCRCCLKHFAVFFPTMKHLFSSTRACPLGARAASAACLHVNVCALMPHTCCIQLLQCCSCSGFSSTCGTSPLASVWLESLRQGCRSAMLLSWPLGTSDRCSVVTFVSALFDTLP